MITLHISLTVRQLHMVRSIYGYGLPTSCFFVNILNPRNGKFMSRPRNGSLGKFKSCDVEHRILIRRNGDTEKLLNIFYRCVARSFYSTRLRISMYICG